MTRKKIYFIRANISNFGGAEVYLSRLSHALKNQNIEHEIIFSILKNSTYIYLNIHLYIPLIV